MSREGPPADYDTKGPFFTYGVGMTNSTLGNTESSVLGAGSLLTLKEVADLLRLTPQTLYKMLKKGSIPAVRVGSQWRFEQEQIRQWIAARSSSLSEG
jgi:excisionase family DNA binding protein